MLALSESTEILRYRASTTTNTVVESMIQSEAKLNSYPRYVSKKLLVGWNSQISTHHVINRLDEGAAGPPPSGQTEAASRPVAGG